MKINPLRTMICGLILANFSMGTNVLACHDNNDALNTNHKKHHKKAIATTTAPTNNTSANKPVGFVTN